MKRRWIVFAVLIFALLSFVPVVNGGAKMGWLKVWVAYPAFISSLAEGNSWDIALLCLVVAVLHIGLSAALGIGLDRFAKRIEAKRTSTASQPIARKSGSG
jgi:hypothetical protein